MKMNVYKCDRCRSYFDDKKHITDNTRYMISSKNPHNIGWVDWDLCPDCYEKLKTWLKDGKDENSE